MADTTTEPDDRPLWGPTAYLLLVRIWMRAASQYRVSLLLTTVAQLFTTCLDLIAILVIYSHVRTIGGFTLPETLYLYGTTRLAFAVSDALASGVENLATMIRLGNFDLVLIRPVSSLAQVLADQFTPKRFGKLAAPVLTLGWAIDALPLHWTAAKAAVAIGTVVCGLVLYCALWVLTGCISFIAVDAQEVANSFTYGSENATEYPLSIFGRPLGLALTFVLPVAFVTWQPSLYVLGHPDPFGLPEFLRFASPAAAAVLSGLAALAWRACIRHYRSTGS
ncbi:ABC-2 family transporter protein [Actinospica sp. MGRD01-02]|uniref:ABC-2 family transporter protein n=1 Tax=Actinospica acidithermotolerans TaxID=2828514 RepID=A0A941IM93_9ACTN|nr:ABC-2 family transporter protein [Actinospica acidithermotolerans]MBR7830832.1 ABC-2 family transporter protein [Actinospica acidithermotolerans]